MKETLPSLVLPSDVIVSILDHGKADHGLSVDEIAKTLGPHGFGLSIVLLALPAVAPLPPGLGAIPGSLLFLWGLQRFLGRKTLWLPLFLRRQTISPRLLGTIDSKAVPVCRKLENYCQPSLPHGRALKEWESRLAALMAMFMGLLVLLPTPFLNTFPALMAVLLGLTLLTQNRKLLWPSLVFSVVTLGLIGLALLVSGERLLEELNN